MAVEDGIVVPGEGAEGSTMSPAVHEQKVVERAQSKGWKPLEQFAGDPGDWVDAKEFLGREKLYGMIHDLKKQAKQTAAQTEQEMKIIAAEYAKMSSVAYKKALADLKAQRVTAIQDQDIEAVEQLDSQIDEIRAAQAAVPLRPVITPPDTQEFIDWKSANPWFDSDENMRQDATSIGVGYIHSRQGKASQAEALEYVAAKIKKMYPEKFERKSQKVEDSKVEGGGDSRPNTRSKNRLSASDLTEDERTVMKTLVKRGVLKDIAAKNNRSEQDEYLAQLADAKAR